MTLADTLRLSLAAVLGARARSFFIVLAMALGVGAVVTLTALGDGARRYVMGQFDSLGTHLVIVLPGRAETSGGFPGAAVGQTPRDLTLADARSLARLPGVRRVAPINVGLAELAAGGRLREVNVLGGDGELLPVRRMKLAQGAYGGAGGQLVLGVKLAREFFGNGRAVGQRVRLGDRRFRVSGVLERQGESLGLNSDELAIIPIEDAQALFDTDSLFRVLVEAESRAAVAPVRDAVLRQLKARHDGEEDATVITQDAVLSTFDRILGALTLAVGGIAAISLSVAGILTMNVMLVAVTQRTAEIGLMKAIGAQASTIRRLFVAEALWLALVGAALGLALGQAASFAIRLAFPTLPAWPPLWASAAGVATALAVGVLASLMPAARAARLDPVRALSGR